ncbi:unnamed protein product [Effrenium voratum]|nr:unnamed protein product [Effrenium voratum]
MECSTDLEPSLAKSVGSGAYIVYGTALGGHVLCAALFKVKISISLLRHCSIQNIKSSAQNAWTNIGVTTSLVMTTVVGALIEGHEMSPQGFCMEPQQRIHVQQIYVSLGIACLFANINCIIYCVLNLFYWDSLTEADAVAFLRQNPQVLGDTVIYMVESYVFFMLMIAAWVYGTYGAQLMNGIMVSCTATLVANLAGVWGNLILWRPTSAQKQGQACCRRKPRKDQVEWNQLMDAMAPLVAEPKEKSAPEDKETAPRDVAKVVECYVERNEAPSESSSYVNV